MGLLLVDKRMNFFAFRELSTSEGVFADVTAFPLPIVMNGNMAGV